METLTTNPLEAKVRVRIEEERAELEAKRADLEAAITTAATHYDEAFAAATAAYAAADEDPDQETLDKLSKLDNRVLDAQAGYQGTMTALRSTERRLAGLDDPHEFDHRMRVATRFAELRARDGEQKQKEAKPTKPLAPRKTVREAIDKVLAEASEPLHYREITKRIVDRGLAHLRGTTPGATVNAACAVAAKNHDGIEKVAPGTFKAADHATA